jgi:dTDP-glucose pyrophosphorylase
MENLLIKSDETLFKAINKLKLNGVRCLVVEDKNFFLGTLSDGDIRNFIPKINKNTLVKEVFNSKAYFLTKDNITKEKLNYFFIKKRLDLLPICKKNKKIIKIIKKQDYIENPNLFNNVEKIPILIMSGGEGKRLSPITEIIPKPLIPINGKSAIENIIDSFRNQNFFGKIIISVNYFSDLIISYIKKKKITKIYFLKEYKKLGTLGALSLIKFNFKNIMITNCDIIFNINLKKFISFHNDNKNDISIIVSYKTTIIPYGICEISKNLLINMDEKPKLNHFINTGFYILNKKACSLIKKNKKTDFDEFIKLAKIRNYKIGVFKIKEKDWYDIGQYNELERTLLTYNPKKF